MFGLFAYCTLFKMKIDWNNFELNQQTTKVCKDIIWLYKDLLDEGGFTHNNIWQVGVVDSAYLNIIISDNEDFKINEKLLRQGAFIYLVCELNDLLYEENYTLQTQQELTEKLSTVSFLNDEKKLIEVALEAMEKRITIWDNNSSIKEFQHLSTYFYMTYVVKYFDELIKKNNSA